jgi:hypothetical protein
LHVHKSISDQRQNSLQTKDDGHNHNYHPDHTDRYHQHHRNNHYHYRRRVNELISQDNNNITDDSFRNDNSTVLDESAETIVTEAVKYAQTVGRSAFQMLNLSIQELLDCDNAADQGCTVRRSISGNNCSE